MRNLSVILGMMALGLLAQAASATTYYYWGTGENLYDAGTTTGWKTAGIWTTDKVTASPNYPGVGDVAYFYSGELIISGTREVGEIVLETSADSETTPTIDNEGSLTVDDEFETFVDAGATGDPGIYEQGLSNSSAASVIAVFNDAGGYAQATQVIINDGTLKTGFSAPNIVSSLEINNSGTWNIRQGSIYVSPNTSYSTISDYVSDNVIFTNSGFTPSATNYPGDYTLVLYYTP